jgi:hypothetical protein
LWLLLRLSGIEQTNPCFGDSLTLCPSGTSRNPLALFLFAAESLVRDYLNGRTLPTALHSAVVRMAESRLMDGLMPVLDETLCREIDGGAIASPP